MKALMVFEAGRAQIVDVPEPALGSEGAVLRPKALGLCGTDLAIFLGTNPLVTYPRIIGHEVAAEVVRVDDPSGRVKAGQRVTVLPILPCGRCVACRMGRPNCCVNNRTLGVHRDGCASELFSVPANRVYAAPREMPWEELALVEPMTIGYHAVKRGRVSAGDRVLIIGAGCVGLGAVQAARLSGASVAAADIRDLSVRLARELGAELAVNSAREDLRRAVRDWTSADGPLVVIEAAGSTETVEAAVELVSHAGRVVVVGYAKGAVRFPADSFVVKELDFLGSRNSLNVLQEVLEHVAAGRIRVKPLVTHRFDFSEGVEALKFWVDRRQEVLKIVLTFD